jgi:hypothetical protein
MSRSFLTLRNVNPGFQPDRVLTVAMQINLAGVPDDQLADFLVQRRQEYIRAVRTLPGVRSAGSINVFPLSRNGAFSIEYSSMVPGAPQTVRADTRYVDPGYFQTMGIALLQGDTMPRRWPPGTPIPTFLSESAARRLFPTGDAIGERIKAPWGESVIAGVVADVRQIGMAQAPEPAIYFPHNFAPRLHATLVVRTAGDPIALAGPVRQAIKEIDPNQPIRSIVPLKTVMSESIAVNRFFTILFAVFGSLALILRRSVYAWLLAQTRWMSSIWLQAVE